MQANETKKLIDGAIEKLAQTLERGESEQLKKYLAVMGRFHRYSLRNAILIAMVRPDASNVAGFHTWRRLGRQVRRGERGIVILAPIVRRAGSTGELGDEVEELEQRPQERVLAFKRAHVFDVSQTEGKPLPEFAAVRGDPSEHLARLEAFVTSRGLELRYSAAIAPAQGACSGKTITLLPGLAPAEEFSTLVHELAHAMLHSGTRDPAGRILRETEAEAVAFVVCEAAGLESGTASSDYIRLYRGDKKMLMESLERICEVAGEIIEAIGLQWSESYLHRRRRARWT